MKPNAKMPDQFITKDTVSGLQPGSGAYINPGNVRVDLQGNVWVDADAPVRATHTPNDKHTVRIDISEEGTLDITIDAADPKHRWRRIQVAVNQNIMAVHAVHRSNPGHSIG